MPLHPVPIIIGTTLAIVGSGYAFKKFIYDPHLAPLIEALLASHRQSLPSTPISQRHTSPIPVSSSGRSTATRDHDTRLRRRARQSGGEYELLDQPRSPVVEDDWRRSPFEAEGIHRSTVIEGDLDDTWGRPSAYDLRESMFTEQVPSRRSSLGLEPPSRRKSSTVQPIIDLDAVDPPISAQDEEIRSVIFNYAPTPTSRRSGASSPAHPISANPLLPLSGIKPDIHASPSAVPITLITPGQLQNLDESTTFSFLSLSQASSPTPHAVLGGMSSDRWAGFDRGSSEDDVVSLPDTITGGYEDAETYSPASRAMSPARVHSPLPSTRSPGLLAQDENAAAVVEEIVMSIVPPLVLRPRGPMSVVSLSESEGEEVGEGWGSEGEWGQ